MRLTEEFGPPFNLIFHVGANTEDGASLNANLELLPLVGQAVNAYATSGLGMEAVARANNVFSVLNNANDEGELTMLAGLGFSRLRFDGDEVAREHAAATAMSHALSTWVAEKATEEAAAHENDAASLNSLTDDYAYMNDAQHDDAGRLLLSDYQSELKHVFSRVRPKAPAVPEVLAESGDAYRERILQAIQIARQRFLDASEGYCEHVLRQSRRLLNGNGPAAAGTAVSLALDRVSGIKSTLTGQRDSIAEEVAAAEPAAAQALDTLGDHIARRRFLKSHRGEIANAIELSSQAFSLRFALDLTEEAIAALSRAWEQLDHFRLRLRDLTVTMNAAARQLAERATAFERRQPTPLEELVDRPLYVVAELRELYSRASGSAWGTLSDQSISLLRRHLGNIDTLLEASTSDVCQRALDAALPMFESIASMSVDDYFKWSCQRSGTDPELLLRDILSRTRILSRYDRAKLQDGDAMYEQSFVLIGVPARDSSVFSGTVQGDLVSTGDRRHVTVLRMKLGMPPSALWGFDRWRAAYLEVKRRGRHAQDIFEGLYELDSRGSRRNRSARPMNGRGSAARRKRSR